MNGPDDAYSDDLPAIDRSWLSVPGNSIRRYFIDRFYTRSLAGVKKGTQILDVGGTKELKRGRFSAEQLGLDAVYINLKSEKRPSVIGDGANLPFPDGCFEVVICAELFEHVPNPEAVLVESLRALKPGGRLIGSTPFNFRVHPDPNDYARFTEQFWRETLARHGCTEIETEKQGLFWCVLMEMLRGLVHQWEQEGRLRNRVFQGLLWKLVAWGKFKAIKLDAKPSALLHPFYGSFMTGIGFTAIKSER